MNLQLTRVIYVNNKTKKKQTKKTPTTKQQKKTANRQSVGSLFQLDYVDI